MGLLCLYLWFMPVSARSVVPSGLIRNDVPATISALYFAMVTV